MNAAADSRHGVPLSIRDEVTAVLQPLQLNRWSVDALSQTVHPAHSDHPITVK